jgi:hypothetical protein
VVLHLVWALRVSKSDARVSSISASVMSISATAVSATVMSVPFTRTSTGSEARNWTIAMTKRKKIAGNRMIPTMLQLLAVCQVWNLQCAP